MTKPPRQERHLHILQQLQSSGEVQVEALARVLHTSQVTVRKDLATLEEQGKLLRRYGGAVTIPHAPSSQRQGLSKRRQAIASKAATLVTDGSRIIIDAGHTTSGLAQHLGHVQNLVIMTNALKTAATVVDMENEPTLIMTGGTWDTQSEAFQGRLAEQVLRAYDFDLLFIGADGIDLERGTTTYNELYTLSQLMAQVSDKVIVMAESEKIGRKIHNLELAWADIDFLVTDAALPDADCNRLQAHGLDVLVANVN